MKRLQQIIVIIILVFSAGTQCFSQKSEIIKITYSDFDGGKGGGYILFEITKDSVLYKQGNRFSENINVKEATATILWTQLSKVNLTEFDKIPSGPMTAQHDGNDIRIAVHTAAKKHEFMNGDYKDSKTISKFVKTLEDEMSRLELLALKRKQDAATVLKVYLKDFETGQVIIHADVTLEGYGLPQLHAKYDVARQYYYFTEMPKNYDTVLATHKDYNEKGFQNTKGLPAELRFTMHDAMNMSYSFEPALDSLLAYNNYKYIKLTHGLRLYVEDPYKIAFDFREDCKGILARITALCPELELINPYYKDDPLLSPDQDFRCDRIRGDTLYNYPLRGGYSAIEAFGYNYDYNLNRPVMFFRKKDGSRFRRFNDPILYKLQGEKLNPHSVVYRKINYIGKKPYRNAFTEKIDALFAIPQEEKSKVILYKWQHYMERPNSLKTRNVYSPSNFGNGEPIVAYPDPDFYMIPPFSCKTFNTMSWTEEDTSLLRFPGLGLGLLDQMEYFSELHQTQILLHGLQNYYCRDN